MQDSGTLGRLLDTLAAEESLVHTVDINPFFHSEEGNYRDVLVADGLHLTDSGYEEMATFLAPKILEILEV